MNVCGRRVAGAGVAVDGLPPAPNRLGATDESDRFLAVLGLIGRGAGTLS
ncbi:MAG: hypothetical protein JNM86_03745 [Phycisphaerae bacterium]|nr:hypothetical protein [Phycisphaerae bacterium]